MEESAEEINCQPRMTADIYNGFWFRIYKNNSSMSVFKKKCSSLFIYEKTIIGAYEKYMTRTSSKNRSLKSIDFKMPRDLNIEKLSLEDAGNLEKEIHEFSTLSIVYARRNYYFRTEPV